MQPNQTDTLHEIEKNNDKKQESQQNEVDHKGKPQAWTTT
jgi:hypothetical protein